MNKNLIAGGALAGLVVAGGVAGMVSAQSVANATGLTEDQVIEIALQELPGEVEEVERERYRGLDFYEVEILTADGGEVEVKIAAETGEILSVKEDADDCDKDHDEDHDDDEEDDEA